MNLTITNTNVSTHNYKVDENSIWTTKNKKIILITPIQQNISKPHYSILPLLLHGRNKFTEHQFRQRTDFFCQYAIKSAIKMHKTNQINVKENKRPFKHHLLPRKTKTEILGLEGTGDDGVSNDVDGKF